MFKTSDSTAKLDAALSAAQAEFSVAAKDGTNPHFRSRYATYDSVMDACIPALTKNKITMTQWLMHSEGNRLHILTRLSHAGEFMQCEWSIPVAKQDPQGYGAASTYAKRFALSAALGITTGEEKDDDGETAVGRGPHQDERSRDTNTGRTNSVPATSGPAQYSDNKQPDLQLPKPKEVGSSSSRPPQVAKGNTGPDTLTLSSPAEIEKLALAPGWLLPAGRFVGKELAKIDHQELNKYMIDLEADNQKKAVLPEKLTGMTKIVYWAVASELERRAKDFNTMSLTMTREDDKL